MGIVTADMAMSLDGFIAGPNDGPDNPLGDGGHRIHEWMYPLANWRERHGQAGGEVNQDNDVVAEMGADTGAVVMGRRMFNCGEVPWGDEPPFRNPVLVVTHQARDALVRKGGTTFFFVTDGVESALAQAREAAGDKNVDVAGGANMIQQFVAAGLLDELQIHLAPLFLGNGVRLFDRPDLETVGLESTRVIESPRVTHIKYRVAN